MAERSALRAPGGASSRAHHSPLPSGPVNAAALAPDATFRRSVRKAFKAVLSASQETTLVRVPWGPRASVIFVPRGAVNIAGGRLLVYAVVEAFEAKIADVAIPNDTDPVPILVEAGCDTFLVRATLGAPLAAGTEQIESYVYAATYAGCP
jgi:hypothetical protein